MPTKHKQKGGKYTGHQLKTFCFKGNHHRIREKNYVTPSKSSVLGQQQNNKYGDFYKQDIQVVTHIKDISD